MNEANGWARRVDQMTMSTAHEQLRTVVREVEESLQRFGAEAFRQYGQMVEAQREFRKDMETKIADVSTELTGSRAELRRDIAAMGETTAAAVAALGEKLAEESKRLQHELADTKAKTDARLSMLDERITQLLEWSTLARTTGDERHGAILGQLGRIADMEDRLASRMVNLLFAAARRIRPGGAPVAPSGAESAAPAAVVDNDPDLVAPIESR